MADIIFYGSAVVAGLGLTIFVLLLAAFWPPSG